jgi:pimeloyl-ACP methyl ester carboxylesterase
MSRISYIRSADGTRIGRRTRGTGPPLVLVHGASADSTVMSLLTPLLEPHYTVHAMDRRGRGLSGDAPTYHITLEYADIAAVVDDVARTTGQTVSLYGHSYGAVCALGAALLTRRVKQLFLYEPGFGAAAALLPAGRRHVDRRRGRDAASAELERPPSDRPNDSPGTSGRRPPRVRPGTLPGPRHAHHAAAW